MAPGASTTAGRWPAGSSCSPRSPSGWRWPSCRVGAYFTVRMQMQSTLDESLLDRAHRAAESPALQQLPTDFELPSWALGAADVRIAFITSSRSVFTPDRERPIRRAWTIRARRRRGQAGAASIRTIAADGARYRVVAVPRPGPGRRWCSPSRSSRRSRCSTQLGVVMLLFGLAGVIAAGRRRLGGRPQRPAAGTPAHRGGRGRSPGPRTSTRSRSRATTRSPGWPRPSTRCSTALAASRDRQRRLVADAGHELRTPLTSLRTNLDLLAQADGSAGPAGRRPAPSCSTTSAPRSRS